MKRALGTLFLVALSLAIGAVVVQQPAITLVVTTIGLGVALLSYRRADPIIVGATGYFLVTLIPVLAAVPSVIAIAGSSISVNHLLLVPLVPFVDWSVLTRGFQRLLLGYVAIVAWMSIWGLAQGAPVTAVLQDGRGPLTFVGGVACGILLYQRRGLRSLIQLVPIILGISAAMISFQALTGREILGGRVGAAVGFGGIGRAGTPINATRFIVSSEDLAVAALLVVFWWLSKPKHLQPARSMLLLVAASSAFIIVLSLSRQLLVGLAVGAIGWLFVRRGVEQAARMVVAALPLVVVAVLSLSLLTVAGQGIGSDSIAGRQLDGFTERVLNGLTSESRAQDAGSSWRERENEFAIEVIKSERLGTGLGRPYRPEFEIEAFGDPTFFRRWVHNVYLWYGTKGGVLGLIAVALVTAAPFAVALRRARRQVGTEDPVAHVSVPILLAFGLMSLVDPVIINSNSGVITGVVFMLLGLRSRPSFDTAEGRSAQSHEPLQEVLR